MLKVQKTQVTFAALSIFNPTASRVSPKDAKLASRNSNVKAHGDGRRSHVSSKAKPKMGDVTTAANAK